MAEIIVKVIGRESRKCPICGATVSTKHPMETIQAQMIGHLRTHGLTKQAARIEFYKITS